MEADAAYTLVESLKLINSNLEKITSRIEVLEMDYKERSIKKNLAKYLMTFYPFVLVILIFMVDADHRKMTDVARDVHSLISDMQNLTFYPVD